VVRTPSAVSHTLSEVLGATVIVKFENLQFTAAYKERGARNRLEQLTAAEREAGVVAMSAGNHAQAVAHHAALLGIPATIVMPEGTPFVKVARTRMLGATVELHGETLAEAAARAEQLVVDEGRTFIHPFDDPAVIAGQGTVALELLDDHPDLDAVVVPVGGGGLLAGMAVVLRARLPHCDVVGVQSELYPSMVGAFHGDHRPCGGPTMAEGIAVAHAGILTAELICALADDVLAVSEASIEDGVNLFLEIEKVVSEGAGAAGLAALIEHRDRFAGKRVGVVLTGGNIDPRLLASVILRGLVRSGRLSRLRVALEDRPGSLARLTALVGQAGGNIVEVVHQRLFADIPIRSAEVELAVETLDREHGDRLVAELRDAGYRVGVVPLDDLR
jgi:threonine dehydratase